MTTALTQVDITSIAAGGDGVGRADGMVIFVPRSAPGDVAQVLLSRSKRFARGHLESLDVASGERIAPSCPHYTIDNCGGCQLQHLSYSAQLRAKGVIIADALRRIGHRDVGEITVEPSDSEWRYRRKLTLHLRREGSSWIAGLHPYDDAIAVFDLNDCPITDERVMQVWRQLRPMFDQLPRERALRVAVRLVATGAAVVVEGGTAWAAWEKLFDASPSIVEIWWKPDHGRMRRLGARTDESHAGASFVQVNAPVALRLKRHVLERIRSYAPKRIVDAYAGAGDTAVPLNDDGVVVIAIELDPDAVARFSDRLRAPSRAIVGRVEEQLPRALPADVVLLNPPRTGIDSRVADVLEKAKAPPRAIIYVSCDPATLARDLSRMPRYQVAAMRAYDMFPQTAHVETVCELVPEAA